MHIAALVLAGLIGVTVVFIGARFLLVPEAAATAYGVPASAAGDASAYLSIKGVRDGVSGLVTLALLAAGQYPGLAWFLLLAALIPFGDAVIVLRHGGSRTLAYTVHGGTGIVMIGVALMLLLG
jgi:hypothetical protein